MFIVFWALAAQPAFAQDDESTVARIVDGIAELTFRYAWPTATYESLECCRAERVEGGGLDVLFRLHGRSAFGGGPLWTDVVIELSSDWSITSIHFGRNNAILARPGETMGAIGQVLLALNEEVQRRNGGSPAPGPSSPVELPPSPPPPESPPVVELPPPPVTPAPVSAQSEAPPPDTGLPTADEAVSASKLSPMWSLRLNIDYASGGKTITPSGATPSTDGSTGLPNGLQFILGHIELYRMFPLAPWAYVGVGADLGMGQAEGGRCTKTPVCSGSTCTCPGNFASWRGLAEEYGLSAKMLLSTIPAPGTSTFSLSIPAVRVEHLLSNVSSKDTKCESILGICHGFSADNVALSAQIEFDWTEYSHGTFSGGCGLGGGVMGLFGGLAESNHTHYMWFIRGGPHIEFL